MLKSEECNMNHNEVFGDALWVKANELDICPLIRTNFIVDGSVKRATLNILGFGYTM
jgi:hypothetical protein